ncbi:PepSY domain-containing protein [Shewanella waksmanii]|uniref:PepSY domain-containing protein n=1 Tax=Shewanella waksmanii TaxID=213783 RepID=UPI003735AA60
MTFSVKARRLHRLLALFIGLQMMIWLLSGCYMVLMNIDYIRGNQLTQPLTSTLPISDITINPAELAVLYPDHSELQLYMTALGPRYKLTFDNEQLIVSASDAKILPKLTQAEAEVIAKSSYAGQKAWLSSHYIEDKPPSELSPRWLPVWQINFGTDSLYVSATTAEVVTKRHDYWRLFDVMWMLHIMDYQHRENIHNWLLTLAASLASLMAFTGILLTYNRFRPVRESKR